MTSEKAYDLEQRFNAFVAAYGGESGWTDTGSMTGTGWGKGTGYFRYKLILPGVVLVAIKDLTITGGASVADGTTILSAANGLNSGYRPGTNQIRTVYCDAEKTAGTNTCEGSAFKFVTDGSVQCLGISASLATTVDGACILFTDI